jgi:hypothetical protein
MTDDHLTVPALAHGHVAAAPAIPVATVALSPSPISLPLRCATFSGIAMRLRGPPQICHVAIAKDCGLSPPFETMLPNTLESIPAFAPPGSWLATGSYGGGDLLLVLLGSIDRLCGQFAIALQSAEHEHLFLLAALIGTLTLVFPTHR